MMPSMPSGLKHWIARCRIRCAASPELASGLILGVLVCLAVLLLGGARALTQPAIEQAQHQLLLASLDELLPAASYDNDPASDRILVQAEALGGSQPHPLYRLRQQQRGIALVIGATALDGYSGPIELLIATRRSGELLGVRVTGHTETPGLGDAIETRRSDWIRQFDGMTIELPSDAWQLERNGGRVDQITGATVTSQAILSAVYRTLDWYRRHAGTLFATPSGQSLNDLP